MPLRKKKFAEPATPPPKEGRRVSVQVQKEGARKESPVKAAEQPRKKKKFVVPEEPPQCPQSPVMKMEAVRSSPSESSEDEEEGMDWEEVQPLSGRDAQDVGLGEQAQEKEVGPSIPSEGLVITLPSKTTASGRKKYIDPEDEKRLELNRITRLKQQQLYKTNLLLLLSRGILLNDVIRLEELKAMMFSTLPSIYARQFEIPGVKRDHVLLNKMISWFRANFKSPARRTVQLPYEDDINLFELRNVVVGVGSEPIDVDEGLSHIEQRLREYLEDAESRETVVALHMIYLGIILLRSVGFDTRLIWSLQPVVPQRPPSSEILKKPKDPDSSAETKAKKASSKYTAWKKKPNSDSSEPEDDEKTRKKKPKKQPKQEECVAPRDYWAEVYLEKEREWVSVNLLTGTIGNAIELEAKATKPMLYVLAFDGDGHVKDVTRRYVSKWLTITSKARIDNDWWEKALNPFERDPTPKENAEDKYLDKLVLTRSYPITLTELKAKAHPVYILKSDLSIYEVIPENVQPAGILKLTPFYFRHHVQRAKTKDGWLREAKSIRLGETPCKSLKRKAGKRDSWTGPVEKVVDLFGEWQVEDYMPPIAKDGIVPKNEYGKVELYKDSMLPRGTVHLVLPGLDKTAKKLQIDYAPVVIGFEYYRGGYKPIIDGFVVCEEYKEILLDAWNQEQDITDAKEEEERRNRVVRNWKRCYGRVLLHLRLRRRYCDGGESSDQPSTSRSTRPGESASQKTVVTKKRKRTD